MAPQNARRAMKICLSTVLIFSLSACSTRMGLAYLGGDKAVKQYYEDKGNDVNRVIAFGQTPLHLAAKEGWHSAAELLIRNGANLDARDDWNATPLHYALVNYSSNIEIAEYQQQKDAIAEMLIAKRADLNTARGWSDSLMPPFGTEYSLSRTEFTQHGVTALMLAAAGGKAQILDLLLKGGASPNLFTTGDKLCPAGGWTALHYGLIYGHIDIAKRLLEHGAIPSTITECKRDGIFANGIYTSNGLIPSLMASGLSYLVAAEFELAKGKIVEAERDLKAVVPLLEQVRIHADSIALPGYTGANEKLYSLYREWSDTSTGIATKVGPALECIAGDLSGNSKTVECMQKALRS